MKASFTDFNRAVRTLWSRDIPGNVMKGDANGQPSLRANAQ